MFSFYEIAEEIRVLPELKLKEYEKEAESLLGGNPGRTFNYAFSEVAEILVYGALVPEVFRALSKSLRDASVSRDGLKIRIQDHDELGLEKTYSFFYKPSRAGKPIGILEIRVTGTPANSGVLKFSPKAGVPISGNARLVADAIERDFEGDRDRL